ncbi:DUF418 domain-containing protein [Cytobacillus sp. FJAT-54145]|uniref:DUF418 domain-containing protein n=1 Tax=Cytobacillus spartinae TaxID=3299023 RepID=A0ABW6KBS3_9BACI
MMKSSPVLGKDRIVTIDIIRGFALFGIFLVNMPAFHSANFMVQMYSFEHELTGSDYWLDLLFTLFVDMKFFTIFSFLFGLGFYIFMSRAEQKGLKINRLFSRRLVGLLLIGTLHFVLLWFGDILHTYALTGFLLLLFYKRKVKTMVIWGTILLVLTNVLLMGMPLLMPEETLIEMKESQNASYEEKIDEYVDVYETAGYVKWVSYRFTTEIIPIMKGTIPSMLPVLAMFLFGLAAGKAGIFKPNTKHLDFIQKVRTVSMIVSIPLVVTLALFKLEVVDIGIKSNTFVQLFTSLSGLTLCFFYISALTLLLRKAKWQKMLRPLGFVGQMALTNYLSQTIICMAIFVGLRQFGEVSLTTGTVICLLIFASQILFSYFWLKNFQFGPFEWLWRTFTYGKIQSIKKQQSTKTLKHKEAL